MPLPGMHFAACNTARKWTICHHEEAYPLHQSLNCVQEENLIHEQLSTCCGFLVGSEEENISMLRQELR
jgi:hypothetical protein